MFALSYMASELRRRKGRTVLTALGLGLGVALVVAVTALSTGLDRAQARILEPLTGVGTDLSVTRPIGGARSGGRTVVVVTHDAALAERATRVVAMRDGELAAPIAG